MKKMIVVVAAFLLICTAAFADHPNDSWAIGAIGGGSVGLYGADLVGIGHVGFNLKAPKLPIFWGFYSHISNWGVGLSITGDFYILDKSIVEKEVTNEDGSYDLKLDWYLGIGGLFDFYVGDYYINAGLRIPGGVSWHIIKPVELSVGVAPGFGITTYHPKPKFHFTLPFEISARFWFL